MRLAELTTGEARRWLRERDPTAVLPTGSTEQHGPHLPLDTDLFLAERVTQVACEEGPDLVLPAVAYGYNEKEVEFAGTVSLPARAFLALVVGLGRSLRRAGWRRLLVVNGHGWNTDLVRAAVHTLNEKRLFTAASCSYWDLCRDEIRLRRTSTVPGGMAHAGEFETSLMLHLRPKAVRGEEMVDEIGYARTSLHHHDLVEKSAVFVPERFSLLSKSGVMGSPSHATAEKGAAWFNSAVRGLREFLREFRAGWPSRGERQRGSEGSLGSEGGGAEGGGPSQRRSIWQEEDEGGGAAR